MSRTEGKLRYDNNIKDNNEMYKCRRDSDCNYKSDNFAVRMRHEATFNHKRMKVEGKMFICRGCGHKRDRIEIMRNHVKKCDKKPIDDNNT